MVKQTHDRLAAIIKHNQEMVGEINHRIAHGAKYYSNTYLGKVDIGYVTSDLWIHCPQENGGFGRSFAIHGGELKELYETGIII